MNWFKKNLRKNFTWSYDQQKTDEFRIIEEIDGFRIERKMIRISTRYFGLTKITYVFWDYVDTKLDVNRSDLFKIKTFPFVNLEGAKKELERIKNLPKYHV